MRVGIDSGGTLTDVVMYDEASGRFRTFKTPRLRKIPPAPAMDDPVPVLSVRSWTLRRKRLDTGR